MTNISLDGTNVSGYEVNPCLILLHTFLGCSPMIYLHINYHFHKLIMFKCILYIQKCVLGFVFLFKYILLANGSTGKQ